VADAAGVILARGEVRAVTGHLFSDVERARLAAAMGAIAGALPCPVGAVVAGITGLAASAPQAGEAREIVAGALGLAPGVVRIENDMWIAYHAVFAPGAGHVVYAGTGAIGLHIGADGGEVRAGGRGMLIDDAGSAFWIGRCALDHVWRARDVDPASTSPLAAALDAAIGGADWDSHRTHVYGGGRNAVAQLARAVAGADDPVAREILGRAGAELARLAVALVARVGDRPVALLGRAARLHPAIEAGFRGAAPALQMSLAEPDAAGTAARLAANAAAAQADTQNTSPGMRP
jgi:N-acetylglucosamine kinase-like BadF-type ATPase